MSAEAATLQAKIHRIDQLTGDTISLDLVSANGEALPKFEAGAHIDLRLGDGLVRQYSLCNSPRDHGVYRLGVLREPQSRGGSAAVHDRLKPGDTITISAPRNLFPLAETGEHHILVGGGIGITPLIAMAYELHARGVSFTLHYCAASPDRAPFAAQLNAAPFAGAVTPHFSRVDGGRRFDPAQDLPAPAPGTHIYVCGPTAMMQAVLDGAAARGFAPDQLHKEDFGADVDVSGGAFEVEARASGLTITVGEGQTIAQALADAGISVDVSCEEGVCGTCWTGLLAGDADHRDSFLTEEEREDGDAIMVCCSRAKSAKLVLDV